MNISTQQSPVMGSEHPRWSEFCARFEGSEGVHFRITDEGISWRCDNDQQLARRTLEAMGDIDVDTSLKYFAQNRGSCDCLIYANLVRNFDPPWMPHSDDHP